MKRLIAFWWRGYWTTTDIWRYFASQRVIRPPKEDDEPALFI